MNLGPERLAEFQEAAGMIYNPEVAVAGEGFQPPVMSELTEAEIESSPILSPRRRKREDSESTMKY